MSVFSEKEITEALSSALEASDADPVCIPRPVAEWLLTLFSGDWRRPVPPDPDQAPPEKQQFYCGRCGKSFYASGRLDEEVKDTYQYSLWTAACPTCGEPVRVNDHYWR